MITLDDCAAEDAAHAQHLQPNADVLDVRRARQVWARLGRAWVAAGEPDMFGAFAETALAI